MAWPGTNGNGNGHGPVQTRPTKPVEREVAPRYPIPDPPDPDVELAPEEEDEIGGYEDDPGFGGPVGSSSGPGLELPRVLPTITVPEIKWHVRYTAYVAALHAIRIPVYVLRTLRWAPIGAGRTVANFYRWVTDWEGRQVAHQTREGWEGELWLRVRREHNQRTEFRGWMTGIVGIIGFFVGVALVFAYPLYTVAVSAGLIWLLGWYGAPSGTIIEHVQPRAPEWRKWDVGVIRRAFEKAGLSKPADKDGIEADWDDRMMFVNDPRRDGDFGTSCIIDLPLSKTARDVFKVKDSLASGLRVGTMQLYVTPFKENAGRIALYIADHDPLSGDPLITPLLECEKLDFWEGFPFGVDARGVEVNISMLWTHMLVGSMPRYGKTMSARLVACAAALDPNVRLLVFNGKGDGPWADFERVAHRYGNGVRDDVVDALIVSLEEVWEDVQTRMEKLGELRHRLTESKITREIANDPTLDMPLTLIVIDEVQMYIGDQKPVANGPPGRKQKRGDRMMELLLDIARVAPSAGYMLLLATQRPDSATAKLLTALRDNMGTRVCFRVMTSDVAKMVLGTPPPGKSPTQFQEGHEGVAVVVGGSDADTGATDAGRIIRTYFGDDPIVKVIIEKAAVLRDKLGTLTGHAAGERTGPGQDRVAIDRLLDHILQTVRNGEDKLPTRTVLDRLTVTHSDLYHGWTVDTLGPHLRNMGVKTSHQINRTDPKTGKRSNPRGIDVEEVREAWVRQRANSGSNGNGSNGSNGSNNGPPCLAKRPESKG